MLASLIGARPKSVRRGPSGQASHGQSRFGTAQGPTAPALRSQTRFFRMAYSLTNDHVCVISGVLEDPKKEELRLEQAWRKHPVLLDSLPFDTPHGDDGIGCIGWFGAFGVLFIHSPAVRQLRSHCHDAILQVLRKEFGERGLFAQFLVDRFVVRQAGARVPPETVHRDEPPTRGAPENRGVTFGGWVNVSSSTQYFTCWLGTGRGFYKASGREKGFNKNYKEPDFPTTRVAIPPGALVLFDETILHKVTGGRVVRHETRLHLNVRLTEDNSCVAFPDQHKACIEQRLSPIKSGQFPSLGPSYCIRTPKFQRLIQRLHPHYRTGATIKVALLPEHRYPDYTVEELLELCPQPLDSLPPKKRRRTDQ